MQERYKKNCGSFMTEEHQSLLLTKTFAVVGVGGNGGYIAEFLARQGCKKLILVDFDNFETSNLNRQIFCNEENLHLNKAEQAVLQLQKINSSIEYEYYCFPFGTQEIPSLQECDMIIAAADGNQYTQDCRKMMKECLYSGIPIVEQCIWEYGVAVGVATRYDPTPFTQMTEQWQKMANWVREDQYPEISQPAWICALAGTLVCQEIWKYFSNHPENTIGHFLIYDVHEGRLHRLVNDKFVY